MSSHAKMFLAAHRARKRKGRNESRDQGDAIVVDRLSKSFFDPRRGIIEAVKDVSFSARYGEVFGLLGPNGAGKTTTLRMLATIMTPTSGKARVGGADASVRPLDVRKSIGYLSGNTGLYERLTPRETLQYFGRLHHLSEDFLARRTKEVLELFDMESFADTRCEKLSTGMRQKVSIARTVIHDPPILILDEPTLGLDILIASTMIQFIRECRSQGKCIILSTHIMDEVEKLCDRVGIIHGGRLRSIGALEELREQTGCRYIEDIFMAVLAQSTTKALR